MAFIVNGALLRAARGLLGLRQDELANATGPGVSNIRRIEAAFVEPIRHAATQLKLSRFFESHNIAVIDEPGRQGVVLKSHGP